MRMMKHAEMTLDEFIAGLPVKIQARHGDKHMFPFESMRNSQNRVTDKSSKIKQNLCSQWQEAEVFPITRFHKPKSLISGNRAATGLENGSFLEQELWVARIATPIYTEAKNLQEQEDRYEELKEKYETLLHICVHVSWHCPS